MEFSFKRKSHAFQIGKELEGILQKQILEGRERFSTSASSGFAFSISKLKFVKKNSNHQEMSGSGEMGSSHSVNQSKEKADKPFDPDRNRVQKNLTTTTGSNNNSHFSSTQTQPHEKLYKKNSDPGKRDGGACYWSEKPIQKTRVTFTTSETGQSRSDSRSEFLPGPSSSTSFASRRRRTERIKSIKRPSRYPLQPTSTFYVPELPGFTSSTDHLRISRKNPAELQHQPRDRTNSLSVNISVPVLVPATAGESSIRSERSNSNRGLHLHRNRRSASVDDLLDITEGNAYYDYEQSNYYNNNSESQRHARESESSDQSESSNFEHDRPTSTNSTLMQFSDDEQSENNDQNQEGDREREGDAGESHNSLPGAGAGTRATQLQASPQDQTNAFSLTEFDPIILDSSPNSTPTSNLTDELRNLHFHDDADATSMIRTASINSILEKPPETVNLDTSPGELKLNDRVVWFTELGIPETGTVKWIGTDLDRSGTGRYFAGVEFKNSVGNTSGKWNGKQYFTSHLTRGRFIPISELIMYLDFYGNGAICNAPANITYPDPADRKSNSRLPGANPIICVICQDPLIIGEIDGLALPEAEKADMASASESQEMVTTHCGHLFHGQCLVKWFNMKKNKKEQPCPYCQKIMGINEIIRIYPVLQN